MAGIFRPEFRPPPQRWIPSAAPAAPADATTAEINAAHDVVFSDYASQFPERTNFTEELQGEGLLRQAEFLSTSIYKARILQDNPYLYWRLAETSGTVASDHSGNARHGTYVNTPTLGAASLLSNDNDPATTFTAAQQEAVEYGLVGVTNGSEFTMEFWMKASIQSQIAMILMETPGEIDGSITEIVGNNGAEGLYYFVRREDGQDVVDVLTSGITVFDNQPHHIVVTDKDTAGVRTWRLYVDGIEKNSGTYVRGVYTNADAVVVAERWSNNTKGGWFNGTVDEVALYTTQLSADTIRQHFLAGGGVITAATIAEYMAAHDAVFLADLANDFPERVDFTEEDSGQQVSVTMDISAFLSIGAPAGEVIEVLVASDMNYQGMDYSEHWARGPPQEADAFDYQFEDQVEFLSTSIYKARILVDNPWLYWRLAETSGTIAADHSGNARDGTYINTPTLGATSLLSNDNDPAVTFTAAQLENAERTVAGVTGGSEFTMECWFKGGVQPDGAFIMLEAEKDGTSLEAVAVHASDVGGNYVFIFIRNNGGTAVVNNVQVPCAIYDNNPHHLALTDKDTAGTRTWRFYVDGIEQGSGTYVRGTYTAHDVVSIGARWTSGSHGDWINGTIDEFALYTTELSATTVREHFLAGGGTITSATIAEYIAAHDAVFQSDISDNFPESVDFTEYDMAAQVSGTMDVSWFFTLAAPGETIEVLVAAEVNHQGDYYYEHWTRGPPENHDYGSDTTLDVTYVFADRLINVSDTLDVATDDISQVDEFETIEGLVAANYSDFQGDVEYLVPDAWDDYINFSTIDVTFFFAGQFFETVENLIAANYSTFQGMEEAVQPEVTTIEDYSHSAVEDTTFITADRQVSVSDTLDVAVDDTSQVDRVEGLDQLAAADYTTFQGDVEWQAPDTWDDYQPTATLDISGYVATQVPPVDVEILIAADPNYNGGLNPIAHYAPEELTIEDYSNQVVADTNFITLPVLINVSDTLDVAVDDTSALQQLESIEGLVEAGYSTFYGTVEALQPEVLTVEDYSTATVHDVTYIFATVNKPVSDTLDISVDDISTLTRLETIEGLVAAGYSTFQGSVEILFPPETTIEQNSAYSIEVPIVSTPTPPQPWGPFEAIVDDYTYTAVVDIFETTSSDEVYQPIEPEEGG